MTRASKIALLISVSAPLALVACSRDREPRSPVAPSQIKSGPSDGLTPASGALAQGSATQGSANGEPQPTESRDRLTDEQIMAVAAAVNAVEVDQAKIAIGRAKKKAVKEFAQVMIAHHGQAVKDVNALSTRLNLKPADSELLTHLRVKATETLTELDQEETDDFDEEYIEAQVEMHDEVLKKLDVQLLPNVRNEELKTLLLTMRTQVAQHLEKARALDKSLD